MSVQGVTGGTIPGFGSGSIDSTDLAFQVMQLQIEMLDGEINGRLGQMDQINGLRKAYNERMTTLREYLQGVKGGKVDVPVELLASGRLEWDPAANDGRGGAVMVSDGGPLRLGDGSFRVQQADGSYLTYAEIEAFRPGAATCIDPREITDRVRDFSPFATGSGDGATEGTTSDPARPAGTAKSSDFRTATVEEAQAMAEAFGGTVVASVTAEQLKGRIDVLQELSENLGTDAEVGMLSLNRLLSRRNQALQLASNVMAADNQTAMGIIANMKV
jgi:hypothetical protein